MTRPLAAGIMGVLLSFGSILFLLPFEHVGFGFDCPLMPGQSCLMSKAEHLSLAKRKLASTFASGFLFLAALVSLSITLPEKRLFFMQPLGRLRQTPGFLERLYSQGILNPRDH